MCDKCKKYTIKEYKNCPKCGNNLLILDREKNNGIIFSIADYNNCKKWLMKIFTIDENEFDIIWFKYLNENIINDKPTTEFLILDDLLFTIYYITPNTKNLVDENSRLYKIISDVKLSNNPFELLSESQKIKYLFHKINKLEKLLSQ